VFSKLLVFAKPHILWKLENSGFSKFKSTGNKIFLQLGLGMLLPELETSCLLVYNFFDFFLGVSWIRRGIIVLAAKLSIDWYSVHSPGMTGNDFWLFCSGFEIWIFACFLVKMRLCLFFWAPKRMYGLSIFSTFFRFFQFKPRSQPLSRCVMSLSWWSNSYWLLINKPMFKSSNLPFLFTIFDQISDFRQNLLPFIKT
jgi:hypothetical protein